MTSEAHLTYRWYQAMSVFWAGYIWLGRVRPCHSSVLQVLCPCYSTITVPIRQLILHGSHSSMGLFLIFAVQLFPHWIHPSSTLPPDCCALTSVRQDCSACMQSHTGDCTDLETSSLSTARAQLGVISFWDFLSQFLPSAADLLYSLDHPLHCAIIYNPRLVL